MVNISITQILAIVGFLVASNISLVVYIYKNQNHRIATIEKEQKLCPINKLYTFLEKLKTDICWIKKEIQKKI